MSVNIHVKLILDTYLINVNKIPTQNKRIKKNNNIIQPENPDEWHIILFEYVELNGIPEKNTKYKNHNIGQLYYKQKNCVTKNDTMYNKLSTNMIIKKDIDDYFKVKEIHNIEKFKK
jgi:hypothetical protein